MTHHFGRSSATVGRPAAPSAGSDGRSRSRVPTRWIRTTGSQEPAGGNSPAARSRERLREPAEGAAGLPTVAEDRPKRCGIAVWLEWRSVGGPTQGSLRSVIHKERKALADWKCVVRQQGKIIRRHNGHGTSC